MFKLNTACSTQTDLVLLEQELCTQLASSATVSLSFIFGSVDQMALLPDCKQLLACSPFWLGGSSCIGALTQHAMSLQPNSLAVLQISDPQGNYGVASGTVTAATARQQAQNILKTALIRAGKSDAQPGMIWCYQVPGFEEQVLAGFADVTGTGVPVFGGSSADNDISGAWLQFDGVQACSQLLVVAVLFPSVKLTGCFDSGYRLTSDSGVVTWARGRELLEIDHRPAADVYRRWLGLPAYSPFQRTVILGDSALRPLALIVDHQADTPMTLLSHPAYVESDQRLGLFNTIKEGERVCLMAGNTQELADKAGAVVAAAAVQLIRAGHMPIGGLIVFCGGCMLAIQQQVPTVLQGIRRQLPELPFLVVFTFGEQGYFSDGVNRHGNLMISAQVFGSKTP